MGPWFNSLKGGGAMDIPIGTLNLTLVEAATRQTDAAIDAMQRGEYDVALTLAGAAHRRCQIAPLHINTVISPIPIRMFMPAIATPRQRSALMLSDCNLVFLRRIAFFPRDCPIPNDSRGNPA